VASEEATIALASESTETIEGEFRRRFWAIVARKEGV
jgi:hypothetical protein